MLRWIPVLGEVIAGAGGGGGQGRGNIDWPSVGSLRRLRRWVRGKMP